MNHAFPMTSLVSVFVCTSALADPLWITNESGGEVTFYGQLSPTYLGFDDGSETDGNIADNTHSNSRVGFNFDQTFGNGQKLRFTFETALGAPQSSAYSQDAAPTWTWEKTDLRKIDLVWSGDFGAISFGQGSMASDGVAGNDFSKTTMASAVATSDTAGSYFFRLKNGDLSNVALGDVYSDFDGGRKGRIRYDTPERDGLRLAVAYGTDVLKDTGDKTYYDVAVLYENQIKDVEYAAGFGYAWVDQDDADTGESWAGSFSAVHKPTGLNGTFAAGSEKDGGNYGYVKIGWIGDLWSVGYTGFSADYYVGRDFGSDGSESSQWGIQAAQKFDDWNLEAYIGFAEYSFSDKTDDSYKDASSVIGGVRWKF